MASKNGEQKPDVEIPWHARMWPRAVFDLPRHGRKMTEDFPILGKSGVYILYRDDIPYYVGQATKLITRLRTHHKPGARYSLFWNYFSVFAIENENEAEKKKEINKIEAILITVFPTVNGATPRIKREKFPRKIVDLVRQMRRSELGRESVADADEDGGSDE